MKKKSNQSINNILDLAVELNDQSRYHESLAVLFNLLADNVEFSKAKVQAVIYTHIASNFRDLEEYECALAYFEKGLDVAPRSEINSLGKYLCLHELDRDEEAINEMFQFLESNDADLYRTTLGEMLEGLEEGYMTNYESRIKELARKNSVSIRPGESL